MLSKKLGLAEKIMTIRTHEQSDSIDHIVKELNGHLENLKGDTMLAGFPNAVHEAIEGPGKKRLPTSASHLSINCLTQIFMCKLAAPDLELTLHLRNSTFD